MQREFLIETRSVQDENGTPLILKYYLIEEGDASLAKPLYRICIKKSIAAHPGVEETESTPPVSYSKTFTHQVLGRLIRNAVTPVCLLEIVDEIITQEDIAAF